MTAPVMRATKKCNGQTTEQCCEGIEYCTCVANPSGGDSPLICLSIPPDDGG